MATVTTSPPPTGSSSSSPSRRKPVPVHNLPQIPQQQFDFGGATSGASVKPLPSVPHPSSPRLRNPPSSPVRVNIKPDDWAKPSNVSVETATSSSHSSNDNHPYLPRVPLDRDLPKTPDAPTPPPHTPIFEKAAATGSGVTAATHTSGMTVNTPLRTVPSPSSTALLDKSSPATPPVNPVGLRAATVKTDEGRFQGTTGKMQSLRGLDSPDQEMMSPNDALRVHDENRNSRETESSVSTTVSTSQQQASTESSAATSASSVSGTLDTPESQDCSGDGSPESSIIEETIPRAGSVPQLQYHHQQFLPRTSSIPPERSGPMSMAMAADPRIASTPDLLDSEGGINRHLTPNNFMRRSSLPRPQSAYSAYSDMGPRGRSPNLFPGGSAMRAPSAHSRRSPETRPSSYADMLNVPYPQPAPAPITLDNSQLRNAVGSNASLLSTQKTLEMYRQNLKKTNDLSIQYSFAVFLISTAQEMGLDGDDEPTPRRKGSGGSPKTGRGEGTGSSSSSPYLDGSVSSPHELVREAKTILQKLASAGYPFAQYYLADGYASGLFSKGKEDYNAAFPLFVLAAKHGHAESAYRTGLCYEFGWGCRKDPAKAVQFLRTAASKRHPGAMTRLGKACLSGDLGEKRYREGIKWLKLATEAADTIYNAAPYHLGCLYETGYGDDVFLDENYAAELFTQAADLGHPEANFRMGDAYEHGRLNCPRDPALSVHFYTGAAERGHAAAMMGLCAWYMVGAEPILEKDEEEAYEWARRSAELGHVKAQYAVGYFTEMGIGCRRDILEANVWYVKAADAGDERAKQRLAAIRVAISGGTPMEVAPPRSGMGLGGGAKINKKAAGDKDDNCVVM